MKSVLKGLIAVPVFSLVILGCSVQDTSVPFAASAPRSGLALHVMVRSPVPPGGARGSAQVFPAPPGSQTLILTIREFGDPAFLTESFEIDPRSTETQEVAIGNVPPGTGVPVQVQLLGAAGQVLASRSFLFDFFPGRIASNDALLDVAGTGAVIEGGETSMEPAVFDQTFEIGSTFPPSGYAICAAGAGTAPVFSSSEGDILGISGPGSVNIKGGSGATEFGILTATSANVQELPPPTGSVTFEAIIRNDFSAMGTSVLFGLADSNLCEDPTGAMIETGIAAGILVTGSGGSASVHRVEAGSVTPSSFATTTSTSLSLRLKIIVSSTGFVDLQFRPETGGPTSAMALVGSLPAGSMLFITARGEGVSPDQRFIDNIRKF